MKKIAVLISLFLILQNCALAQQPLNATIKMSEVQSFSQDGNFGLKDKNGNVIVEPIYKKLIKVGTGSWIVQKKDKFGLIDNSGNYLLKPKYRHVERVFGKYSKFGNDNDYGLYDENGKTIISPEYSSIAPLFGEMFLTCKNYRYGVVDFNGKTLLKNEFDDIYMPNPHAMRIQYEGQWYEIERMADTEIELPSNVKKITVDDKEYKVTELLANTGVMSGYSAVSATDYTLKLFSSISPAYEQTIDELMLSQGADTVSIFMKMSWIPRFPYAYIKKYCSNIRTPNNGPLADVKNKLKKQLK